MLKIADICSYFDDHFVFAWFNKAIVKIIW